MKKKKLKYDFGGGTLKPKSDRWSTAPNGERFYDDSMSNATQTAINTDPRQFELPNFFDVFDPLAYLTIGIGNEVNDAKIRKQERQQYIDAIQGRYYYNTEEDGLNTNPAFFMAGGKNGKYQITNDALLSNFQAGGSNKRQPIMVTDRNDKRLKAYQDSSAAYNFGLLNAKKYNPNPEFYQGFGDHTAEKYINLWNPALYKNNKIKPVGIYWTDSDAPTVAYKKPVQPVIYQKEKTRPPLTKGQTAEVNLVSEPEMVNKQLGFDNSPLSLTPGRLQVSGIGKQWQKYQGTDAPDGGMYKYDINLPDGSRRSLSEQEVISQMDNWDLSEKEKVKLPKKMKNGGAPSAEKAKEMLHNPPHGKKLSEKQRKYFGYLAYSKKNKMQEGGYSEGEELDLSAAEIENLQKLGYELEMI